MPVVTITSFTAFANVVVAACKLASGTTIVDRLKALSDIAAGGKSLDAALGTTGLAAVAAEMARVAEDHALHFTHPGRARDDAIAVFWQVAPSAFADPAVFAAAHLDPALTADRMVAAIRAGPQARDFRETVLAEPFFRSVTVATLKVMLARADTVAALAPALWRQSLEDTAAIRDDTAEILAIVRRLESTKEAEAARAAGISDKRILGLAHRIAQEVPDLDHAFAELERAVEVAIEIQTRGQAGSNTGDFVDAVLARIAALSAESRDEEAAAEADRALAEWEERRRLDTQNGLALLDAGLRADILRRNAPSAAERIVRKLMLETPDPAGLFAALRTEQDAWYVRGRDVGLNFDLEVSIALARKMVEQARGPDDRGTALNDLGNVLTTLGERESGTARLEDAVAVYTAALVEWPRDRAPHDWAVAQNGLGAALRALGVREPGTKRLEGSVRAYRAALTVFTREREPIDWGIAKNNLASSLTSLSEREDGTERLREAVDAHRLALEVRAQDGRPEDWATSQNNLGNTLKTLAGRETNPGVWLEQAIDAFHAALQVWTRDRVPLQWARVQMNLGNALWMSGQSERAILAYGAALEEWTRERAPLDWATAYGNQGVALGSLAIQSSSALTAQRALAQITEAEQVLRDGGHVQNADYFRDWRSRAEALISQLTDKYRR